MRITYLIFFFLWNIALTAQYPAIRHYTIEDGLPSSNVYYSYQDSKGFVWVCTDKGLALFDGYQFKVFTVKDGLPSNDVWSAGEDEQGRIWLGTFNELVYYKEGRFHTFDHAESQESTNMYEHRIDRNYNHFFFNKNQTKLFYRDRQDSIRLVMDDGYNLIAMKENEENAWLFADQRKKYNNNISFGAWAYINDDFFVDTVGLMEEIFATHELYHENLKTFEYSIETSLDGSVYIRKEEEIAIYDKDSIRVKKAEEIFGSKIRITRFAKWSEGYFLVGGNNQYRVLNSDLQVDDKFDFIKNYNLSSFSKDRNDNWYFNTSDGLFFLSSNALTSKSFLTDENNNSITITSVFVDSDNVIWMGGENDVLYRLKDNRVQQKFFTSLGHGKIREILMDSKGYFYIAGKRVLKIHKKELNDFFEGKIARLHEETYIIGQPRPPINLKKVCLTENDELYLAGQGNLYFYTKDTLIGLGITHQRFYGMAVDKKKNLWLGAKSGIYLYPNKEIKKTNKMIKGELIKVHNLPVNDLQLDNTDKLWIATDGYGLYRSFNQSTDTIHQIKNEIVNSITVENDSTIWACTNKGIRLIKVLNEVPFKYNMQKITTAHGLVSNEINRVYLKGDSIYAATNKGLTILNKTSFNKHTEKPVLHINNIIINENKKELKQDYQIKYNQNNINIEYVCLSFKSNKDITYYYKMDGIDTQWKTTRKLQLNYPILPPNTYTFHLKAQDIDGGWTAEIAPVVFTIHPPWWQTLWFKIAGFAFVLLSILLYVRSKIEAVKRKSKEENLLNKKFAELELRALQAQMNPHFIFNALNAIQGFMFLNEERMANKYIAKFSKLMRLFLESSKERYIRLSDELELLELYIELEQVRFENKFNYKIKIDKTLDPTGIEIPSMLLQPYVENAINHGLMLNNKKGQLNIDIKGAGNKLLICIEDDGIGRAKAMEIKRKSADGYKSRGTQIVEERQRVLNYIENTDIEITTIDFTEDIHYKTGTRVEILVVYKYIKKPG